MINDVVFYYYTLWSLTHDRMDMVIMMIMIDGDHDLVIVVHDVLVMVN